MSDLVNVQIKRNALENHALKLFKDTIMLVDEIKKSGDEEKYKALYNVEVAICIILTESGFYL